MQYQRLVKVGMCTISDSRIPQCWLCRLSSWTRSQWAPSRPRRCLWTRSVQAIVSSLPVQLFAQIPVPVSRSLLFQLPYLTLLHSNIALYLTRVHFTLALPYSTSLCYTLQLPYLTLLHSTELYDWSTLFYLIPLHTTRALPDSTSLYFTLPWIYFIVVNSTIAVLDSTWLYYTPTLLYSILRDSTSLYDWSCSRLILLHTTMALPKFTSLYCTVLHSTIDLLYSTRLYYILPWLCIPYSTSLYSTVLWLYWTPLDSTTF